MTATDHQLPHGRRTRPLEVRRAAARAFAAAETGNGERADPQIVAFANGTADSPGDPSQWHMPERENRSRWRRLFG